MISSAEGSFLPLRKLSLILIVVLVHAASVMAFKVTVDSTKASGAGNYQTLNALLLGLAGKNPALSTTGEDTVLFTDTTQRVYVMSEYMDTDSGSIRFLGATANPDKFPVINHTASDYYSFFNKVNVSFERLVLTGKTTFSRGATSKSQIFRKCVIRDYASSATSFFAINGAGTSKTIFENCLFIVNNFTNGVVDIKGNPCPALQFINCTFHANASILTAASGAVVSAVSIKNCVFSANNGIFGSSTDLVSKVTYSVVPSDNYSGTGNVVASDPRYTVPTGKSIPSDWRLTDSSIARGLGDTTGAPKVDISGKIRNDAVAKCDAGCWDILDGVEIVTQPKGDTAIAGEGAFFKVTAIGAPVLSFAWYKKGGGGTPLSVTDSFKLSTVSLADDSSRFYCIITNPTGSVTSDTVLLRVYDKPYITDQPDTLVSYIGDTAAFSVAATGGGLTYSWSRNGTAVSGATAATLKVLGVGVDDSGAVFRCTITNSQGSITSQAALLQVLSPGVKITAFSKDTTLDEGAAISLSVTATGKKPLVYVWTKVESKLELSATSVYTKTNAMFGDSGLYRCVVSNTTSKDSVTVKIGITAGASPRITSQSEPVIIVKAGSAIELSVSATGALPLSFTWYKKNGSSSDSVGTGMSLSFSAASAADSGLYFCVVKNSLGSDTSKSITLNVNSSTLFNPLSLECSFVDRTHVLARVKKFRELSSNAAAPPYADTVGIWYKDLTVPSGTFTRSDQNVIKLSLSRMNAVSGDVFDTLITVPGTGSDCNTVHFVVSPIWKEPDTVVSSVSSVQQSAVVMCDTTKIVNKLVPTIIYNAVSDSITVQLSNLTSINRDSLSMLFISYALGAISVIDTILPAKLPAANVDAMSKVYHNALFAAEEEMLTVTVTWQGILGNSSTPSSRNILVGKPRPANTAQLSIDSSSSSSVFLRWQFSGSTDFDQIRLVWGIPPITPQTDVSGASYKIITLQNTIRSAEVENLLPSRFYYFAVQVIKDSVVSILTNEAIASCSTQIASGEVVNSIKVTTAEFLPATNQFKLVWTIDTLVSGNVNNLETGIVWAAGNPPNILEKITNKEVLVYDKCKDVTSLMIDAPEDLMYSTTYHFALILRYKAGLEWASATSASRTTVVTGDPVWQKVTYFKGNDTLTSAFNGQVVIKKIGDGVVSVTDTLLIFSPDSLLFGFVPASRFGFDFKHDAKSDPVRIGMLYDESLLGTNSEANIRIYQYSPIRSEWNRIDKSIVDTMTKTVWSDIRPSDNPLPFMLLVDTLPPQVKVTSDTASPVVAGSPVIDTLIITDNTANSDISLVYWGTKGNGGSVSNVKKCSSKVFTLYTTIPSDSIIRDHSIKAELVISDGISRKICDVSRMVIRQKSDPFIITEMKWTPVMTTAILDVPTIENSLKELCAGEKWKYDPLYFRLFRWLESTPSTPLSAATAGTSGWLEYSNQNSTLFTMEPGRVVWVKSRKNQDVQSLGSGTTVPVKEPYAITLKARSWTDIAVPFRMDIKLGDVFAVSNDVENVTDKVLIYSWTVDTTAKNIVAVAKYVPRMSNYDMSKTVLTYKNEAGGIASYTLFNLDTSDIKLKIPPLPEAFSTVKSGITKRSKNSSGWSVELQASTDKGVMSPVFFGSQADIGKKRYPVAPSFSKTRISLMASGEKTPSGILFDEYKDGAMVDVVFENDESADVQFNCDWLKGSNLPEGWSTVLYQPDDGVVSSAEKLPTIGVSALSKKYAVLITGDSAFVASGITAVVPQFTLFSIYPNPCRGEIAIRFTLPPVDIKSVRVSLFDQLGRTVWDRQMQGVQLRTGYNTLSWNMREKHHLSAGTYILKLEAYTTSGRSFGRKQQRFIYLP